MIPVGVPGAGKSSLASALVAHGYIESEDVISTDDVRTRLGGDRNWLASEDRVFRIATQNAQRRLSAGGRVYFDATNILRERRIPVLSAAHKLGISPLFVRFSTPLTEARHRRIESGEPLESGSWERLVGAWASLAWDLDLTPWAWDHHVWHTIGGSFVHPN